MPAGRPSARRLTAEMACLTLSRTVLELSAWDREVRGGKTGKPVLLANRVLHGASCELRRTKRCFPSTSGLRCAALPAPQRGVPPLLIPRQTMRTRHRPLFHLRPTQCFLRIRHFPSSSNAKSIITVWLAALGNSFSALGKLVFFNGLLGPPCLAQPHRLPPSTQSA